MNAYSETARRLGLDEAQLEPWGRDKAKLSWAGLATLAGRAPGRLILVTSMSPTPAGEGKTTTVIGLGDALNRLGRRAVVCLRQPSLGPTLGLKGGAAGGGRAQLRPMEDINLHFTGDFHAVAAAHNLLAALTDNHLHHGNALGIDPATIAWPRVLDMNDRVLRRIHVGLDEAVGGYPRESGFEVTAASEVMAILCLAESLADLKRRLGDIVVGATRDGQAVRARDLKAEGAMAALLKDALKPNLVATLEGTPAFVHGGPFGNIAQGCSSLVATRAAMGLADYVVTEAGFGADLGAEKFLDIKCRVSGLRPAAAVIVATLRALKYHGGADRQALDARNGPALEAGIANLARHADNMEKVFRVPQVVAVNRFGQDSPEELDLLLARLDAAGLRAVVTEHFDRGGEGAQALAAAVAERCAQPSAPTLAYEDTDPLWEKIDKIARRIYRAAAVTATEGARARLAALQAGGYGHLPVCIAKTPYSFSTDRERRGAPEGHVLDVREVRLAAGAGFVVVLCGDVTTMPGLPRRPAAERIGLDEAGRVSGLA